MWTLHRPCPVAWETLPGGVRRACATCGKDVVDLEAVPPAEREPLLRAGTCARVPAAAVLLAAASLLVAPEAEAAQRACRLPAPERRALAPGEVLVVLVQDDGGLSLPRSVATLSQPGRDPLVARTDEEGHARFVGVGPGTWTLRVEHPGFEPTELVVRRVPDAATATVVRVRARWTASVVGAWSYRMVVDPESAASGVVLDRAWLDRRPR